MARAASSLAIIFCLSGVPECPGGPDMLCTLRRVPGLAGAGPVPRLCSSLMVSATLGPRLVTISCSASSSLCRR